MRPKQNVAIGLRRRETEAERVAWRLLRDRRILGFKFRRQHPVAGFIVDFYCAKLRLVIEIDGPVHETSQGRGYDRERDAILEGLGLQVVRIPNGDVTTACIRAGVRCAMLRRAGSPSPVSRERG
jgi:very-short-patch-repair endonuclease